MGLMPWVHGERGFIGVRMIQSRVLLSWSSGKDSAWSLHVLRQQPNVEVVGLLTTFNEAAEFHRGVRRAQRVPDASTADHRLPRNPRSFKPLITKLDQAKSFILRINGLWVYLRALNAAASMKPRRFAAGNIRPNILQILHLRPLMKPRRDVADGWRGRVSNQSWCGRQLQ